jgi:hypothetical protein
MEKCILFKTPETVDLIFGLYERLDIMYEAMGDKLKNVEGVNLKEVWENMFKELNEQFRDTQEEPILHMKEEQIGKLLFFGDMVGQFFSLHGDETDNNFLKNLTILFEQATKGQEKPNMEECWKYIKG